MSLTPCNLDKGKLAVLSLVDLVGPADTRTPQIQLWLLQLVLRAERRIWKVPQGRTSLWLAGVLSAKQNLWILYLVPDEGSRPR